MRMCSGLGCVKNAKKCHFLQKIPVFDRFVCGLDTGLSSAKSKRFHLRHNKKHAPAAGRCLFLQDLLRDSRVDFLHKILFFGKDVKVFFEERYFC